MTVKLSVVLTVCAQEVTCTVAEELPAWLGTPLTTPVLGLSESPDGRAPFVTCHDVVPYPPEVVTANE